MAQSYNLPDAYKGDTYDGQQFTVTINSSPANLTGASIRMDLRDTDGNRAKRLTTGADGGLTITNASGGVFQIDTQVIDLAAATYNYDIEITFASGEIKTFVVGTLKVVQDVTYG